MYERKIGKSMRPEENGILTDVTHHLEAITAMVADFNRKNSGCTIEIYVRKQEPNSLSLESIMHMVCQKMKTTPEYINMDSREDVIKIPRQMCHYIAYHRSKRSTKDIGFYFGRKNHSTVIHSTRTIKNLLDTNREFRDEYYEFLNGYSVTKHIK